MRTDRKVLLVEDEVLVAALAVDALEELGYRALEATSSKAALALVSGGTEFEFAVIDIGLPDGDGFELARRLRDTPRRPRVVLISADSDAANGAAAQRAGASGFFPKDELSGLPFRRMIDEGR